MDTRLAKQARQLNMRNGGPNCPIPPIVLMTDDQRLPNPRPAIAGLPRRSIAAAFHAGTMAIAKRGADITGFPNAKPSRPTGYEFSIIFAMCRIVPKHRLGADCPRRDKNQQC